MFQINSNISAQQTGSANERFLRRSVRNTNIPTVIKKEVDPTQLVKKRIINHENRILSKNTTNKIIYNVGDRVMIQNVKSILFEKFGTITKQRRADNGAVVSYDILEDDGWKSFRHRKHLRLLQPEHDNMETNLNSHEESTAEIPQVPPVITRSMASKNDVGKSLDKSLGNADRKSHRSTGIRKSDRLLKRGITIKKVSCSKGEVKETSEMGASSSKDCGDLEKENEHLKTRIKLYEAGISDSSDHGSQTNIGLLNLSSENNSGTCSCPASGGLRTMEITGKYSEKE